MLAEDNHPSETASIVVRLLNSALRGCEFLLRPGRTLFLVGPSEALTEPHQLPELPGDTLYVPLADGGVNFEILIDADAQIRELGQDEVAEYPAGFNQIIRVGALELALRPQDQSWLPEVLNHPRQTDTLATKPPRRRNRWLAVPALLALLAAAGLGFGSYEQWLDSSQRKTTELSALLGNNPQRFQILPGQDGRFYVAAASERDTAWARQALLRSDDPQAFEVITPLRENERIGRWLAAAYPDLAYYCLQLNDPRHPQLWISQQRAALSAEDKMRLAARLVERLPYADKVDIVPVDDDAAAREAEAGLRRLALPFRRKDNPDSVVFAISGSLGDDELQRARQFVDRYYRQWGGRYVQFAIELKDDSLKDKSFMYGNQGYIKLDASHWYFPHTSSTSGE
ncbi:PrgH/EprH family type III secretion apparatus protein [Chromobacterium vaccinii]|uniref:PrgH/EprH family type III secretion apparatus protein n=1 Tax=Chromobacterium vaccinii TaxID=1108595 RepID=UPI001E4BAFD4|nr:PrgH/EprH family type III secretion apparatus protein [Chromobacterium vaccinii]MCD4484625.1 PrgH/EprH family type III secretion apparatus protein [Chromobacterium vaccinii]